MTAREFAEKHAGAIGRDTMTDVQGRIIAWTDSGKVVIENARDKPRTSLMRDMWGHMVVPIEGARTGWTSPPDRIKILTAVVDRSRHPHTCPRCKSPAYVGAYEVDCTKAGCR